MRPPHDPDISLDRDRESDVVEFGSRPGPPVHWRRWALPVALVLALGVAGAVAVRSGGDEPSAAASPTAGSPSPTPTATASPLNWTDNEPVITKVGHPLLGVTAGWELFARSDAEVIRIELAAGRYTRTPVPNLGSGGPVSFLAMPDSVMVRPMDNVVGYLIRDTKPTTKLQSALEFTGPALPGPQPGTVWISVVDNGTARLVLVNADGARVGPALTLPATTDGYGYTDGSGNVLVSGIGGFYLLGPNGAQRITTGRLLATGATRWLTEECDDRARCSLVVIDKTSGAKRQLPNAPIPAAAYTPGTISPDGRIAALVDHISDTTTSIVSMIDLNTGAQLTPAVSVNNQYDESGVLAWSPDSRWLFFIDERSVVHAVDTVARDVKDLGITLPAVQQLAIRPPR